MNVSSSRVGCLLLVSFFLMVSFAACGGGGGGGSDDDGILTAEENDDRVGRPVIRCAMTEVTEADVAATNRVVSQSRLSRWASTLSTGRDAGSVNVPVVVHVISSGGGADQGNVSDDAINQQIAILNLGFSGAAGGTNSPYRFTLTQITRTVNARWAAMELGSLPELEAKTALRVGGPETLNLYLAAPQDSTLGWAAFPWDFAAAPILDGVVLLYETLPGGTLPPYNEGDTGVHEVGHWLGLFHTFQDGCLPPADTIGDTPPEAVEAFGCPAGRNTCPGDDSADPISNYMDYSDDACLTEFTGQQVERMDLLGATFRAL